MKLNCELELSPSPARPCRSQEYGAKQRHHSSPDEIDIEWRPDNIRRGRPQDSISNEEGAQKQKEKCDRKADVEPQGHLHRDRRESLVDSLKSSAVYIPLLFNRFCTTPCLHSTIGTLIGT